MGMKSQKGAAAVEFAIVVPLLLVIVFGIIEFSVLLYDKAMITNASREGARVGIVYVPTRTEAAINPLIISTIKKYCENNLISFQSESVQVDPPIWSGLNSGDSLTVSVKYKFDFLVFSRLVKIFNGNLADYLDLKSVTVMRLE